jgi:hypothetical protein
LHMLLIITFNPYMRVAATNSTELAC